MYIMSQLFDILVFVFIEVLNYASVGRKIVISQFTSLYNIIFSFSALKGYSEFGYFDYSNLILQANENELQLKNYNQVSVIIAFITYFFILRFLINLLIDTYYKISKLKRIF